MTEETPGQRVYRIRLALGDGLKNPMTLRDFVALLRRQKARYDPSTISRIENGTRTITLKDVQAIAAVDPLKRGRDWLAWGASPGAIPLPPGVTSMEFDGPVPEPGRVASGKTEGAAKRPKGGHRPRRRKASGDH